MFFVIYYAYLLVVFCQAKPLRENDEISTDTSISLVNVKFYLYTNNNPKTPQELFTNNEDSVKSSYFNNTQQTKIIIHGWLASYKITPNVPIRDAYLSQGDYNIIAVDWEKDASSIFYFPAVAKVQLVGKEVAKFVDFLNEKFDINFDSLVLIGHSLGAHVAGYCGKLVKRGKLSYIVGLDPASPLFSYDNPAGRLSCTDANYVETIQTHGKFNGFKKPIGTATFYANWGYEQPGCDNDECSHIRSIDIYAEAIRGYSFAPIYRCQSYENIRNKNGCLKDTTNVSIGDPSQIEQLEGIYNFETNSKAPYGKLQKERE